MTERRETSFDGYVSVANGGRGMLIHKGPRWCKRCERFRERMDYDDFICRHMRGYKEAPAHVRRCPSCDDWKKVKVFQRIFGVNIISIIRKSGIRDKDGIDFLRNYLKNTVRLSK